MRLMPPGGAIWPHDSYVQVDISEEHVSNMRLIEESGADVLVGRKLL